MRHRRKLLAEAQARGIRLTSQRRALIETIEDAPRHLDAAALLAEARKRDPDIDRATVYRTIDLLKKQGLIDELDLMHVEGEKHYYEVRSSRDHIHLTCVECGAVKEFTSPLFERLKEEIARQNRFDIKVIRLEVGGRCSRCAGEHKAESERSHAARA